MSISYDRKKINRILQFALILILVLALAYALGAITLGKTHKSPVTVTYPSAEQNIAGAGAAVARATTPNTLSASAEIPAVPIATTPTIQSVVASKKGTKYHLPNCPGAKTILPENKIIFKSAEEARKAGYGPAKNCKGLKAAPATSAAAAPK